MHSNIRLVISFGIGCVTREGTATGGWSTDRNGILVN